MNIEFAFIDEETGEGIYGKEMNCFVDPAKPAMGITIEKGMVVLPFYPPRLYIREVQQ